MPVARKGMNSLRKNWKIAANSRLSMEFAGLSFALKKGCSHEEYAQHLWGKGAKRWIKKDRPTPQDYVARELEACPPLFPEVKMESGKSTEDTAELIFVDGCPGGWGKDKWSIGKRWGLTDSDICRYCTAAFAIWGRQLGLNIVHKPQSDGRCVIKAENFLNERD